MNEEIKKPELDYERLWNALREEITEAVKEPQPDDFSQTETAIYWMGVDLLKRVLRSMDKLELEAGRDESYPFSWH